MKRPELYILSVLILCGSVALQIKPKQGEKSSLLRFDGIYVYDNGIDTIIKDYEFYQEIKGAGVFELAGFYDMPDTGWTAMQGSRKIECIRFYTSDTLIHISTYEEFNHKNFLEKIERLHKKLSPGDKVRYYQPNAEEVFFFNTPLNFNVSSIYEKEFRVQIKKDTLVMTEYLNGEINPYIDDAIKTYIFYRDTL